MAEMPLQENLQAKEKKIGASATVEIEVLWITAGLGCDGDTIAMTAATQPSIEDVVLGALPWVPKVNVHNPFLALANGDDFMKPFHQAAEGKIDNYILVIEGSIPNEHNKEEGYWASLAAAVEFNWDSAYSNIQAVRPDMRVFKLSSKTEEGMEEYLAFLAARLAKVRPAAAV